MSRVKSPIEKKRLSLTRDHRTFALEGNKTFRKAWRMKKVKAARQLRRAQGKADRDPNDSDPGRFEQRLSPRLPQPHLCSVDRVGTGPLMPAGISQAHIGVGGMGLTK